MEDYGYIDHGDGLLDLDRYERHSVADSVSTCARCGTQLGYYAAYMGDRICDECVAELREGKRQ